MRKSKILIIQRRPGIGDMCVFLPCINAISKNFHNYEVHVLTKERSKAKDFLKYNNFIKKIIYLPKAKTFNLFYKIYKILKVEKYELCFIMHYGVRYYLISKLAKIKNIFFYGPFKKNENIVKKSQIETKRWLKKNEIEFDAKISLGKNIKKKNQIILGIGGSGPTKKWKISNYINLATMICKKNIFTFVIAGGPLEIHEAYKIKKTLNDNQIKSISICDMEIGDTLEYLNESKLYIGNDTGFMHLSGCLGVKSFPNLSFVDKIGFFKGHLIETILSFQFNVVSLSLCLYSEHL